MENINVIAERIRNYVINNEIKKAISDINYLADLTNDDNIKNQVITVCSQYNLYHTEKLLNTENDITLRNKSVNAVLNLLNSIENVLIERNISFKNETDYPHFNNFFFKKFQINDLENIDNEQIERAICLYNYEKNGKLFKKRNNIDLTIFNNPAFLNWKSYKRKFEKSELIESTIIKISNTGTCHKLHLKSNNSIEESEIHTSFEKIENTVKTGENMQSSLYWNGNWKLNNGILEMNIGNYQLLVFANKKGLIHSGIEFENNEHIWLHDIILVPFRDYSNYSWE
jgi:hypothetical protein